MAHLFRLHGWALAAQASLGRMLSLTAWRLWLLVQGSKKRWASFFDMCISTCTSGCSFLAPTIHTEEPSCYHVVWFFSCMCGFKVVRKRRGLQMFFNLYWFVIIFITWGTGLVQCGHMGQVRCNFSMLGRLLCKPETEPQQVLQFFNRGIVTECLEHFIIFERTRPELPFFFLRSHAACSAIFVLSFTLRAFTHTSRARLRRRQTTGAKGFNDGLKACSIAN